MWSKKSWQKFYSKQLPIYNNIKTLNKIKEKLSCFQALVEYRDIDALKVLLSKSVETDSLILQMGECAESFKQISNYNNIKKHYDLMFCAKHILEKTLNKKVITIGRIAGQFAKPRSNLFETRGKASLNSFKGEIINGFNYTLKDREHNPYRMLLAYCSSKKAIQYITEYNHHHSNDTYDKFFISHEALLLDYEECFTRKLNNKIYNLSAHMLWLGARTSKINDPHVEYLKGIANPIGIKIHPQTNTLELVEIIKILNPFNKKGKIVLITRLGKDNIIKLLSIFIEIIKKYNLNVTWLIDPMHGNTKMEGNFKVREFQDILSESLSFVNILKKFGIKGYGIHLEVANTYVTECIGGIKYPITKNNLSEKYLTLCDPRLNRDQTVEMLSLIANEIIS